MLLHLVRSTVLMLVLTIACCSVSGQKMNIVVVVKDTVTKQLLSKATVVIIGRRDSVLTDFGITDSLGKYLFKNVNLEKAGSVTVSSAGYLDKIVPLAKPGITGNKKLNDTIIDVMLAQKFIQLEDVVVLGASSPIKMNKDTLEFDADFFKSHPNSVLEDLLRKLPGVEVRQGNEVYVNGQRVNKILINGKEFFSSDPAVILKNLPAEIIAKVQVADEKNTIAKETRQQKDIPKTINLKLKKEFKSGIFGKYFAGRGTNNRYEAGGILNAFRDTLQVSLIGSSNNQGRGGFSMDDLNDLGGFSRSEGLGGQNSWNLAERYSRGIETKNLAGVNINYDFGKTMQLNGQYFYNQTKQQTASEWFNQQFISDSVLLSDGTDDATAREDVHTASMGFKWKQDSTGYLTAHINAEFNTNEQQGISDWKTFSPNAPLLSGSYSGLGSRDKRNNLSVNTDYSKTFVPLHVDWTLTGSFSNNASNSFAAKDNRYVRIINNFLPYSLKQQLDNSTPSRELSIENRFNKNWKDKHSLSWKTAYINRQEMIGGDTYQYSENTGKMEFVKSLSIKLILHKQRLNNEFSYRYSYKGFTIQPGIAIRTLKIQNRYNYDSIPVLNRTYNLVAPVLNITYKGIGFSFNRTLEEPYAYSLKPVTDSSSPLYTIIGNPDLRPAATNVFGLEYNQYFTRSKINIYVWSSAEFKKDAVGDSRQVFADGKTVNGYFNVEQVKNFNAFFNVSKSYNKNDWNYNTTTGANLNIGEFPVMLNQKLVTTKQTFITPTVSVFAEYKNKYKLQIRYRFQINRSQSDDSTLRTANTSYHTLSNTLHVQLSRRLSWDANLNYNINPGTPEGYKKQWFFCDMAFTCSFLKKDRAQVKLSGFDIFNQNQGISRFVYQNYIIDNKSLVQKQYFMLTVLYTMKKF